MNVEVHAEMHTADQYRTLTFAGLPDQSCNALDFCSSKQLTVDRELLEGLLLENAESRCNLLPLISSLRRK